MTPITMLPVESTNIAAIGHDPARSDLHVQFKGGPLWIYNPVSAEEYAELLAAPSIGSQFYKAIKMTKVGREADVTTEQTAPAATEAAKAGDVLAAEYLRGVTALHDALLAELTAHPFTLHNQGLADRVRKVTAKLLGLDVKPPANEEPGTDEPAADDA